MTRDKLHLLHRFSPFSGKADSSYCPNDRNRDCCLQVSLFTDMKSVRNTVSKAVEYLQVTCVI